MAHDVDVCMRRPRIIVVVETLATGDRRLKVLEIAREVGMSYGSVMNILHEHLGLSKVCARWGPRLLTAVQKSFRVETCFDLLAVYAANPDQRDETWIHAAPGSWNKTGINAVEARRLSAT